MVQFAGFASSSYGFTAGYPKRGGLPHSDISGSTVARTSPELFAACHVLHRLSVPRHPPDALTSRSPTPSPKHALRACRCQMSDDNVPKLSSSPSDLRSLISGADAQASPRRGKAPRQVYRSADATRIGARIPMPGSGQDGTWPDPLHGFHDSLHDVKRADVREPGIGPTAVRALCKLEEAGVGGRRSTLPLSDRS